MKRYLNCMDSVLQLSKETVLIFGNYSYYVGFCYRIIYMYNDKSARLKYIILNYLF